jgi:hypothetical protein
MGQDGGQISHRAGGDKQSRFFPSFLLPAPGSIDGWVFAVTSSPSSASAIARRMAGVGWVTVSERRSIKFIRPAFSTPYLNPSWINPDSTTARVQDDIFLSCLIRNKIYAKSSNLLLRNDCSTSSSSEGSGAKTALNILSTQPYDNHACKMAADPQAGMLPAVNRVTRDRAS